MAHSPTPARHSRLIPGPLGVVAGPDTPTYWFDGNPFLTHFMNAFSGILPEGERFLIAAVRRGRTVVAIAGNTALQDDISGFIGQEAYHAREHQAINDLMRSRGVPFERLEAFAAWTARMIGHLPHKDQMAIAGATEHLTALFGKAMLSAPEVVEQVHPNLRPLFVWHALEELEHKSVAFDVFQAGGGGYFRRIEGLILITLILAAWVLYGHLLFMWCDRSLFKVRAIGRGLRWMFGFGPRAGYFRRAIPEYFRFLKSGFHPSQDDTTALEKTWRQTLDRMMGDAIGPSSREGPADRR